MICWNVGPYEIEYSLQLVTISKDGYYINFKGSEAICRLDSFTDDCTNEGQIDKYFDLYKVPNNGYCD